MHHTSFEMRQSITVHAKNNTSSTRYLCIFYKQIKKRLSVRPVEWLKVYFASCVVHLRCFAINIIDNVLWYKSEVSSCTSIKVVRACFVYIHVYMISAHILPNITLLTLTATLQLQGESPTYMLPVAPVAYQVILEPGMGQFREFEPRRVHTRVNSLGIFLVHKLTRGKARERELTTLDEKSTSSGIAEPYARQ